MKKYILLLSISLFFISFAYSDNKKEEQTEMKLSHSSNIAHCQIKNIQKQPFLSVPVSILNVIIIRYVKE